MCQYSLLSDTLQQCGVPNINKSLEVNKWHHCGGGSTQLSLKSTPTNIKNPTTLVDES